jgi:hypothetical protein
VDSGVSLFAAISWDVCGQGGPRYSGRPRYQMHDQRDGHEKGTYCADKDCAGGAVLDDADLGMLMTSRA